MQCLQYGSDSRKGKRRQSRRRASITDELNQKVCWTRGRGLEEGNGGLGGIEEGMVLWFGPKRQGHGDADRGTASAVVIQRVIIVWLVWLARFETTGPREGLFEAERVQ